MGRRPLLPLALLVALAWLALGAWGLSPYARYLDHAALFEGGAGGGWLALVFVAGWVAMCCAMMLPTVFPLARQFGVLVQAQPHRGLLLGLLAAGYLAVWSGFGFVALGADALVHAAVPRLPGLAARPWLVAAAVLVLAGAYQLAPLKDACLRRCRSPRSFLVEHWNGRNAFGQAFRLGAHHGAFCLGCCWALMLLMFAAGLGSLVWMLALATLMSIEKAAPWGRTAVRPTGLVLIAAGLLTAALGLG